MKGQWYAHTYMGVHQIASYTRPVGGADTHRMDLSSMIMLKDNHIASRGEIAGRCYIAMGRLYSRVHY